MAMRKLSLQQFAVSVDGHILEEGTPFHRLYAAIDDPQLDSYFVEKLGRGDLHIMGRVTYLAMSDHWPRPEVMHSDNPHVRAIAAIMNDIPKVVFSRSLTETRWPEARIASGDTAKEIERLKSEPGGEIIAHGGAQFVRSLARLGVVDEYRLYVMPFAIGEGLSLFGQLQSPQRLRLVSNTTFPSGAIELVYERLDG
jgi:dihydrofolate reductase